MRDFRDMGRMTNDEVGHLAMIAHHVYKSFDLSVRCLVELADRGFIQGSGIQKYTNTLRSS